MTTLDLTDPSPPGRWRAPAAWLGGVIVYALVLHFQIGLPFSITIRSSAVYVVSLALLSYPARRWARRSLAPARPVTTLAVIHAAFACATLAAWFGVNLFWDWMTIGPSFWVIVYANNWLFQLLFGTMTYGTVIGLTIAVESFRRERDRERREAALLVQARDAELGAIRSQFQPHFVMNALNSLLTLIDRDPVQARAMVVRLADVMKEVFDREDTPLVPLARELDLIRAYLDVEHVRFGSRLTVSIDVDAAAAQAMVPAFLLQPIVENAVKHGIAPFSGPGRISIGARIENGTLIVVVRDSGRNEVGDAHASGGRGLALTRRRLQTMYGDRQSLALSNETDGVAVRMQMPAEAS